MNVNGGLATDKSKNEIAKINTVSSLMGKVDVKRRFEEILGKKAQGFISSVINVSKSKSLVDADPNSIMASAVVAATLDLPIDPNLGFSYIVPYNDKKSGKIAQFQMGYKGFIQLAQRTGQYKTINAIPVFENEIKHVNRLTGEIELFDKPEPSTKIVGYVAYFSLLNGFEKALYMTREELEKHGKKYSQSYKSSKDWIVKQSLWTTDFDSMATKTVLKLLLSKYGPMSIEMQTAIKSDQASFKSDVINGDIDNNIEYPDNPKSEDGSNPIDADYKENTTEDKKQEDMFEGSPFEGK